jgi:glucosylceramidase
MKSESVHQSAAISRKLLLFGIGFVLVGASYGQSVTWMRSSSDGDKMKSQSLTFHTGTTQAVTITVNPSQTYQTMVGFGGSFTDAGAYCLNSLNATTRKQVIDAYFGPTGANYSICRTQIGASDFSTVLYNYDSVPGDYSLSHFSVSHDSTMIIRWIKDALAQNPNLKIFGSPWSAPAWMKQMATAIPQSMDHGGTLLPSCDTSWALYFVKYIQAYAAQGIPIWGITIQNEPETDQTWPSMRFTDVTERDYLKNYLGPMLARNNLGPSVLNVMFLDHNRDMMIQWANTFYGDPTTTSMVWGEAIHWYDNQSLFADVDTVWKKYPKKNILATEQCITLFDPTNPSSFSWINTAELYAKDIIGDVANGSTGWVDWNMVLNTQGLPNLSDNACYAGVLVNTGAGTFQFTSLYYYMTQFSKYVRTGAVRIGTTVTASSNAPEAMAFKNPDSSIVVIVHNPANASYNGRIVFGTNQIEYATTPYSVDDFYWAPPTSVVANTVKQSRVNTSAAGRLVLGLNNSQKQQNLGASRYTLTGERISAEGSKNAIMRGVYFEKPSDNEEKK